MTDIEMYQNLDEFVALITMIRTELGDGPLNILEVGSLYGGTLITFMANFPGSRLTSVDLGIGQHDHRAEGVRAAQATWPEHAATYNCDLLAITGDSHAPEIIARAQERGPFDLVFIDGDHTYAGVKQDAEAYGAMVRPGGLIAFHDVNAVYGPPHFIEVRRFWDEYRRYFDSIMEICAGPNSWGIGVVKVG